MCIYIYICFSLTYVIIYICFSLTYVIDIYIYIPVIIVKNNNSAVKLFSYMLHIYNIIYIYIIIMHHYTPDRFIGTLPFWCQCSARIRWVPLAWPRSGPVLRKNPILQVCFASGRSRGLQPRRREGTIGRLVGNFRLRAFQGTAIIWDLHLAVCLSSL